ncbi:MAG: GHKL domain-containing protein [Phycisphaerales bacterium]|nr:GHKL domain-containing protein [Phycisphaerales bacterium]
MPELENNSCTELPVMPAQDATDADLDLQRQRLLSIFDSIDEGIYISDPDTYEVLYVNEALRKFWKDAVGTKCYQTFQNLSEPCPFCTNDHIFGKNQGKTYIWEFYNKAMNRWYRCIDKAIHWPDGRMVRYEMAVDITDRKLAEEELVLHRQHLEELVAERTRQLDESREKIRQSERLASIGTLAAGIAHEINNPIGMMLLAAQIGLEARRRGDSDAVVEESFQKIVRNAERCGRIVKSVLQFARQEKTEKWATDLNAVIEHAVTTLQPYAQQRGATLACQLADPLPEVIVSPLEIEQVFLNLLRNAMESAEGQVQVCISTEAEAGLVRVIITDNGRGMSAIQKKHLFDPFFTTRQREGGTGLGLSITHGIVTDHGGTITVTSREGVGSTFVVELPIPKPL